MYIHATEEQQIEAIKGWWKKNGSSIITGVLIALIVVFGWRYWTQHKEAKAQQVSVAYQQILEALQKDEADVVESLGNNLVKDYSDTSYAALAALALAKVKLDQDDSDKAAEHLQWVIDHAKQQEVQQIARVRLANVRYSQGQYDAALAALDVDIAPTFSGMVEALKGDIYAAQGELDKARSAYQTALQLGTADQDQQLVQMKLNDLGAP